MFERFTDRARRAVVLAQEEARMLNHNYLGTEHLLLGLIREGQGVAATALGSLGIDLESVRRRIEEIIGLGQESPVGHLPFTPRAKVVLDNSLHEARALGDHHIGTEHVLLGLVREGEGVAAMVLVSMGASMPWVRDTTLLILADRCSPTEEARGGKLGSVLGREREIGQLTSAMLAGNGRSPLLIGERGVGVTSVLHGFAGALLEPEAPEALAGMRVLDVDMRRLLRPDDDALQATTAVRNSMRALDRHTIVFVRNILMMALGVDGASRVRRPLDVLLPMLVDGTPRIIGAATPEEYRAAAAPEAGLGGLFAEVTVNELPEATVLEIVRQARDACESRHRVGISDDAIAAAVALSAQHIHHRAQPGKALDLLDRAAAVAAGRIDNDRDSSISQRVTTIRSEMGAAIDVKDYGRAAELYDQELSLLSRQQNRTVNNIPTHRIVEVTEADVSRALADLRG